MQLTRWRHPGPACLAALALVLGGGAAGAQDHGRFQVRNAFVELRDGTWLLDVRLDLALAEDARQALDEGVPLLLDIEAEASVKRRFLPDATVATLSRKWQLSFDAITGRWVVTDVASGERRNHATEEEALEALSRIGGIEVADTSVLPPDGRFAMRVRATVEVGEVPAAIKLLLFWRSWTRSTDWYAWSVRP